LGAFVKSAFASKADRNAAEINFRSVPETGPTGRRIRSCPLIKDDAPAIIFTVSARQQVPAFHRRHDRAKAIAFKR
jgi:hypothetical protein